MSDIKDGLKYSKEHEWIRLEGNVGTVGITDFAQHELGEIVYIEMPAVGDSFSANDQFGTVESVKAASDLFIPVSGKVIEVNHAVEDAPDSINTTPYSAKCMTSWPSSPTRPRMCGPIMTPASR